jgi:hypothetical protein
VASDLHDVPASALDSAAMSLCDSFQSLGIPAFVIRTTEDGGVRFIGPQLPTALVARMLRSAADGYEAQVPERTVQ